ncbi:MAG: hypothetical protein K9M80_09750, partial [Candidatus Marinimicrobia bacterium]|nr:hypothetical protein [Candidatus Neomarinimicrobiota bacterium]
MKKYTKTGNVGLILDYHEKNDRGTHCISVKINTSNPDKASEFINKCNGEVKEYKDNDMIALVPVSKVIPIASKKYINHISLYQYSGLAKKSNIESLKLQFNILNQVKSKLSPGLQNITKKYLLNDRIKSPFYSIYEKNNKNYISIFMDYEGDINILESKGVKVGTVIDNLLSARLPLLKL